MRYVAGLDGGGTKTAVMVADETGRTVDTFVCGAINYNGQDEAGVRRSLQQIFSGIARACGGLTQCAHICIGAAGVSHPAVAGRLTDEAGACGYRGGLTIVGDHETALYGALERPSGIILIAGTGSICYGRNDCGLSHRAGGFGHLVDDEGSGYSIGRDLLAAVLRASDGRLSPTPITELVFERLQMATVQQLIGFVYDKQTNKQDIAALAPLLAEACAMGDQAALAIAKRSAAALCELVMPVAEKLAFKEGELATAGSVLLRNAFVQSAFAAELARQLPGLRCFPAKRDAAAGAVLLALDHLRAGREA